MVLIIFYKMFTKFFTIIFIILFAVGTYYLIYSFGILKNNAEFPAEYAELRDMIGVNAGGEANRSGKGNKFFFGLRAKSLPETRDGKFYAVWLAQNSNQDENKHIYYAGRLSLAEEGRYKGDYVLGFTANNDMRAFKHISVTLEEKDDQIPEQIILEGNF